MNNDSAPGGVFVGRRRELDGLAAAFEDTLSGQGRLAMLAGEPGIGKTRTAGEVAAHAMSRGARVLWGWCYERKGAPPYWPWLEPIRSYVQEVDGARLESEMGPGAADIAAIVPEVREKLPGLEPTPPLEPEQARFRLFDSIAVFLKNASNVQPLMIVLEDLHWADRSSLMLLEFVAREIAASRVFLLGTYRDTAVGRHHALSQTLGTLVREPVFRRVRLRGLSRDEVAQFVEVNTGVTLPGSAVGLVHSRTEGNPFFLSELVRLVGWQGMGNAEDWARTLPEGVRDAIGRRLDQLSESCNVVLTTAAVIGREFDYRLLKFLTADVTEDRLLEVLDEALEAHVIHEVSEYPGRYQFTHTLIQQTLTEELSAGRKARLHAQVGEALEDLYGTESETHAAELAYHFAEAEPVVGPEKVVRYSLVAGERAFAAFAHQEALAHFERALAASEEHLVLEGAEHGLDDDTAAALYGLGRVRAVTVGRHRIRESVDLLRKAFDYYAGAGQLAKAVDVAEYPIPAVAGHSTGMAQLLERALELVPPDSHDAGRLLALYGRIIGHQEGNLEAALGAFERALAIARRERDVPLEMRTLASASYVDYSHLRYYESIEKSSQALELAHLVDDPYAAVVAYYGSVFSFCAVGNLVEARSHAASCLAAGERLRDRYWRVGALERSAAVHALEGDWPAAREYTDRGLALSPDETRILAVGVASAYQTGEFERGRGLVKRLVESIQLFAPGANAGYTFPAAVIPLAALIAGDRSGLPEARQAAETVLRSEFGTPLFRLKAHTGLAMIAVVDGDAKGARDGYEALLPVKGTSINVSGVSVDRLLGLLARTLGDPDGAAAHFEEALAFCRGAGYRPELGWCCFDYADTLLRQEAEGGRSRVESLLEEALQISRELGMRPLLDRAVALRDRAGQLTKAVPVYPDGLSEREVQVLRLVSLGNTNQDIAEELVISLSTVAHHVSNIFHKTGVSNRAEAATYAARHGLV